MYNGLADSEKDADGEGKNERKEADTMKQYQITIDTENGWEDFKVADLQDGILQYNAVVWALKAVDEISSVERVRLLVKENNELKTLLEQKF